VKKRLVVCCDGTWNVPDHIDRGQVRPSNVVHIALSTRATDDHHTPQVVFYDKGVGTNPFEHLIGGAFGFGLSAKVKDAYRFIAERYEPGDEIFLFGFSRGAYTARSTAGLIRNIGVLTPANLGRLDAGYELYRRRDSASDPSEFESQLFRRMYACEDITPIRLVGVWDTVGALGIPVGIPWLPISVVQRFNRRWAFHDLRLSRYVKFAYHAVAIDERRPQFSPSLWEQQRGAPADQVLEQAWFAGVHSNVGGGYENTGLSAITLLWMKERAGSAGLAFDEQYFSSERLVPNPLGLLRDSRIGFYRWFPPEWRTIGASPNGHESVSPTALERLHAMPSYRPRNLLAYEGMKR
jgi:uncharacterized protein (DUF2235 family)